ncbi:MAG TPA: DegT/DnrJ/EryC1/StrS family aminotransferase [Terriglobales bacterium]|nr:DegT/DnrJ/EryC1/StrS family aminotransferase [Terriglobales bacterium]
MIGTEAFLQFPFLDLRAQYRAIKPEVDAAVARVFDSQYFILSPEVASFENELATYIGARHAVGCASGTDALLLALMAVGVEHGDEVITVPFTFVATAGPIALLGGKPVFVDIDPATFNIDVRKIEAAITPKTKAIIPVDLFGLMAPIDEIKAIAAKHGIAVIEDAAQAIGARRSGKMAGSNASLGCFSFFPSKNLGGAGDGGLVTTNDPALDAKLRKLRGHGSPRRYEYEMIGVNSRLDSVQAAVLSVKLKYLDKWAEGRRRNAAIYRQLFAEVKLTDHVVLPIEPSGCHHIYNQYTIRCQKRDELRAFLTEKGIPTEIYYPYPLHLQKAFAFLGHKAGDFPASEKASLEVLSLPIYPELGEDKLRLVVEAIGAFYNQST